MVCEWLVAFGLSTERAHLFTSSNGEAQTPEIFGQILFHLHRRGVGHRVQVRKQLRQKPHAMAFDHGRRLDARFVIRESFFGGQAGHAHVDTRLFRVSLGILGAHFAKPRCSGGEQHYVNVMMQRRLSGMAKLFEGAASHFWGHCSFSKVFPRSLGGY